MLKNSNKIKYKILICDDNTHYVDRLYPEISKLNYHNIDYCVDIDVGITPETCMEKLRCNTYDIIILDVCIRDGATTKTNYDVLWSLAQSEYYGPDMYKEAIKHNPEAKVFVLSNLKIFNLRTIFNNADVEYFCKKQTTEIDIARHIKNYFDTGKKRIYNNVFIVYGHNEHMRTSVEKYVNKLGLKSIDLLENSSGGLQTIFDALVDCANAVECAIILLSADDVVLSNNSKKKQYRARQNVIFEMGFFAGFLGENKVIVLYEEHEDFEFPSDVGGIFYIKYDNHKKWNEDLFVCLKKIGFEFNV